MIILNEEKNYREARVTKLSSDWLTDLSSGKKLSLKSYESRFSQSSQRLPSAQETKYEGIESISRGLYWLTTSNPKTLTSLQHDYLTAVLHLAPAKFSGYKVCKNYSQCQATCLFHQGRGKWQNVQDARIKKTRRLVEHPENSIQEIAAELSYLLARLNRPELPKLAVRLNCLSDIPWESVTFSCLGDKTIFDAYPQIQFYDYTKYRIGEREAWDDMPLNYHLTYSFDGRESDIPNCLQVLERGHNVKMILTKPHYKHWKSLLDKTQASYKGVPYLPITSKSWGSLTINNAFSGIPAIDGNSHDLRFLDPSGVVLMGKEKGYSEIAV